MTEEKWYHYWWYSINGLSNEKKKLLSKNKINPEDIYNIEETQKKYPFKEWFTEEEIEKIKTSRAIKEWKKEYRKMKEEGARLVCWEEEEYPKRLKTLSGMPYALFVKGQLPEEDVVSVAIVGARNCSTYGERMTLQFAEQLAQEGVQIISGMARGIDGAAHRGALNVSGRTFAVLGCGADICYPKEHKGIYHDIQNNGGIVSEYLPGTPPLARHFPARNRLISGLSDVVLVMEAKERSGSLITADMALEQGRDIYALPGPINSELSKGCNYLIRQGAGILLEPEDILEELSIKIRPKRENCQKNKKILESKEEIVYSKLGLFARGREELLQLTGFHPQELAGILLSLELRGYIKEISKNYYIVR